MGSLCSSTNVDKSHHCNKSCFGIKATEQMQCQWCPSRPFKWEYTNDHSTALKLALSKDQHLNEIGQDVINIIEKYILSIVMAEKEQKISYKRIHSKIYDETDSIWKKSKICDEYISESGYYYDRNSVTRKVSGETELKIVVLGEGGVGKTMLCRRIITDNFYDEYDPGIEDSYRKVIEFGQKQQVIYDILDTAGQDEFIALVNQWIRYEGDQFWLCFDLMRASTFDYIMDKMIPRIIKITEGKSKSIIIVGCKSDLKFGDNHHYYDNKNKIDSFDVMKRIEEIGDFPYIETSSKDKINTLYLEKVGVYEHWIQTQSDAIDWDGLFERYKDFNIS